MTLEWASDYDIFDPQYVEDPAPIWAGLRAQCPVAHTERWGGSWLPTRMDDVRAFAQRVDLFSSDDPLVVPPPQGVAAPAVKAPPISSDPPEHTWARRLILPFFSPGAVDRHEPATRETCRRLIGSFIEHGHADAAADYAQQIPVRVIAHLLGIDEARSDEFVEWVRGTIELGLKDPELRVKYREKIHDFFWAVVAERRAHPGDDMISQLLAAEVDGQPVPDVHVVGTCNLLLIAGIDTTWSSIGAALWHLATHAEDRRRLVAEPELLPVAIEEFLRAYAPVTMGRVTTQDCEFLGREIKQGDKILMSFPAANRDPEHFPDPDAVIIDREVNRHVAFGVGIHRCAGSNLARMEMRVALEEWLARIPEFELAPGAEVTWAGGQVRGPRSIPVVF